MLSVVLATVVSRENAGKPVALTCLEHYDTHRHRQGRGMQEQTPMRAFLDGIPTPAAKEGKSKTEPAHTAAGSPANRVALSDERPFSRLGGFYDVRAD